MSARPRIAIAGLHNEASGFSLHRADAAFFRMLRGDELLGSYEVVPELVADGVEFVPVLVAMGGASGPVLPEVFDAIEEEVAAGLTAASVAGPLDGVYLHMHGAVGVEGREGAEEAFVRRVREIVGEHAVIGMSMDPHGNLSRELASLVDLASVHRHSPHIDNMLTPGRVLHAMVQSIRRGQRPHRAWVRVPVLLPGERTSTVVEPGSTVFARVEQELAAHPSLVDAGLWVGFAWADEPRNAAAASAVGWDPEETAAAAERLAVAYWDAREDFAIVSEHSGSYTEALDFVLGADAATPGARPETPVFISDSGDNVTAGATGDSTVALTQTLADRRLAAAGVRVLVAGIHDPAAVEASLAAGPGGTIDLAIGATIDRRYAEPVPGPWRVIEIIEGQQGEGVVGALLAQAGSPHVHVTVQTTRQRFVGAHDPSASHNGAPHAAIIPVEGYDAVVVKNGYLFPTQIAQAGSAFMAITPGGTDLDFDRLRFTRRAAPLFPWERDFVADLTAELLPARPGAGAGGDS